MRGAAPGQPGVDACWTACGVGSARECQLLRRRIGAAASPVTVAVRLGCSVCRAGHSTCPACCQAPLLRADLTQLLRLLMLACWLAGWPHNTVASPCHPPPAGTSFEDVTLHNSSDFYRWLADLEAARSSETEEKFRRYGAALGAHLETCDGLLAKVGGGAWCGGSRAVRRRVCAHACMSVWG